MQDELEKILKKINIDEENYEYFSNGNLERVVIKDSNKLYAVRKDSPLIIGIGEDENYIASDIAAIINYTNKYILLEDNEIVEITAQEIKTYKDGVEIKKDIQAANITAEEADKGSYKHYMLKEIMEEPIVLARSLNRYINNMESVFDVSKWWIKS